MTKKAKRRYVFPTFEPKLFSRKEFNHLFILCHMFPKLSSFQQRASHRAQRESLLSFTDSFGYSSFEIKVYSQLLLLLRPQETFSKEETPSLVFLFNKGIFAPGHPVFLPQYPQFCAPFAFAEQPQRLLHFEVKNLIHIFSTALALIEGVFSRHLTQKNQAPFIGLEFCPLAKWSSCTNFPWHRFIRPYDNSLKKVLWPHKNMEHC